MKLVVLFCAYNCVQIASSVITTPTNGDTKDLLHPVAPNVYGFKVKAKGAKNAHVWFRHDANVETEHDIEVHLDDNSHQKSFIRRGHGASAVILKTIIFDSIVRTNGFYEFWFSFKGGYFRFGRGGTFGALRLAEETLENLQVRAIKASSGSDVIQWDGMEALIMAQIPPLNMESYRMHHLNVRPRIYQPVSGGPDYLSSHTGVRSAVECAALCARDRSICSSSVYSPETQTCGLSELTNTLEHVSSWPTRPIHSDNDFYLLLAVTHASNIVGAYDMWNAGTSRGTQPSSRQTCNCAYLNGDRMSEYSKLKLIRYQFLEKGRVVVEMDYDTVGANKIQWMSVSRLRRAFPYSVSWIKGATWTVYSVTGENRAYRRFSMSYYNGCPGDRSFIAVADAADICTTPYWRALPGGKKPGLYYMYERGIMANSFKADEFRLLGSY